MRKIYTLTLLLLCVAPLYSQQGSDFDSLMRAYGLVDIEELSPSILVDLKYSSEDNFVGVDMYGDLEQAYLIESFAAKVAYAQQILQERNPNLTLLIYDAARPISVQRAMRRAVENTEFENFVADGTRGGRHNYGVAVDLTIATLDGTPLDMGAEFDEFSDAASVKGTPDTSEASTRTIDVYRQYTNSLVDRGLISISAATNRLLLLEVMCEAGLVPYRREWWHFEELMSIAETRSTYRMLDF